MNVEPCITNNSRTNDENRKNYQSLWRVPRLMASLYGMAGLGSFFCAFHSVFII